jgi:hypothetical protein
MSCSNKNINRPNQKGGAGSDFSGLWYSWEVSPAELSRITLEKIDCAPMFNPLRKGTVIPTGTTGIIPAGVYLAALPPLVDTCATVECYNREQKQIGLVVPAQQVAYAQQQQQQLQQENGLANFMGMNVGGPQQTGAGLLSTQKGGDARSLKYKMMTGGCCGQSFYTGDTAEILAGRNGIYTRDLEGGGMAMKAQQQHAAKMSQTGGQCAFAFPTAEGRVPMGTTTRIGPNQLQQGGTLSNGLGYSPFKGSQWTATSCANSCVPFNNTCGGRQPVYYSETESREGCTTRCKMPPGHYSTSNLGCRATAFANRDIDYGTYDDLHGTNVAANAAPLPQPCVRQGMRL